MRLVERRPRAEGETRNEEFDDVEACELRTVSLGESKGLAEAMVGRREERGERKAR